MARIVRLEFGWIDEKDYIYYKPTRGGNAKWGSMILNKEFQNHCLPKFKPKGTRAMLVLFAEGEDD